MSRPTKITIDLEALRHNLKQIRTLASGCYVIAMVKSNAYGHGIERIAAALPDVDAFGVASSEEGLNLRNIGIEQAVILMEGLFTPSELPIAIENNFTLVVHDEYQVDMLEKFVHSNIKPISVWIKIDTGMHRLGFAPEKLNSIYQRLQNCHIVNNTIGLMTHFAEADSIERASTLQQIELFDEVTKGFAGPRSLANSAGIIAWPKSHADWVRPGIMLYGVSPFFGHRGSEYDLKPVMNLSSKIIAIHSLNKGARVGYGGTWTCPEDMLVGVVGIGYGDGYPWNAPSGTPVLVNGRPCPIVGRVSMDMLTIDLRTQTTAKIGENVLLWGQGLPVEVIAEQSKTSPYELLTRITQRVRVVTKSAEPIKTAG